MRESTNTSSPRFALPAACLCAAGACLAMISPLGCAGQHASSGPTAPAEVRPAPRHDPVVNREVPDAPYDPARIFSVANTGHANDAHIESAPHADTHGDTHSNTHADHHHGSRPGVSTSPQFSMFGDVPASAAHAMDHALPFDSTENLRRVSFASEGADFDPALSPDGQWLYFASTRHRPTADLYVKSIDGQAVTQLTTDPAHDVMPALSPDGTRVAFASNRSGSWDIYVMNAAGGQAVQVTTDSGDELHPSWGPSGHELIYCRLGAADDRWQIWLTDVARPGVHTFLTYGLFPHWQPGGDTILFQRSRDRGDRAFAIWTVTLARGEAVAPTEVASSAVAALINPAWSASGTHIAFAAVPLTGDEGNSPRASVADIWIMNADGTGKTNLTAGAHVNLSPTWGPGDEVYFVSDRAGADSIWRLGSSQAMLAADVLNSPGTTDFAGTSIGETDPTNAVTSADEAAADH